MENYLVYLKFLQEKLSSFFEKQKQYIFCKKGCGECCKHAQFPFSQIEFIYLLKGIENLNDETLARVLENIKQTKQQKAEFEGEKFLYDCPFLIDNVCCVYENRGIICRSFGLMTISDNNTWRVPFCFHNGLNYSNVMEDDGSKISKEKFKKLNVKEEPLAFNVHYKFLTDKVFEQKYNFKFGEERPLIDWLSDVKL